MIYETLAEIVGHARAASMGPDFFRIITLEWSVCAQITQSAQVKRRRRDHKAQTPPKGNATTTPLGVPKLGGCERRPGISGGFWGAGAARTAFL